MDERAARATALLDELAGVLREMPIQVSGQGEAPPAKDMSEVCTLLLLGIGKAVADWTLVQQHNNPN